MINYEAIQKTVRHAVAMGWAKYYVPKLGVAKAHGVRSGTKEYQKLASAKRIAELNAKGLTARGTPKKFPSQDPKAVYNRERMKKLREAKRLNEG
jgi:hypothetical protein